MRSEARGRIENDPLGTIWAWHDLILGSRWTNRQPAPTVVAAREYVSRERYDALAADLRRQGEEIERLREAEAAAYGLGARDEQARIQSILRGLERKREQEGDSIRSGCYDFAALRTYSMDPGQSAAHFALRAEAPAGREGE